MTDIIDDLQWRGLIAISTDLDALRAELRRGPVTFYCGFDPSAPSLHLGNLVQLIAMRQIQEAGHKPLALVGGATGLIGDPKPSAERTLNPRELVAEWVERIKRQIEPFLDFTGEFAARMVNNLDWTDSLSTITFLRDIGQHFRVNRMIAKEVVAARLNSEAGISYTEFSYQILQGMDYLELFRRYGCRLQTGGSDQWGNLTSGTDLIRRVTGETVHLMATPLILKADGTKFGKTEGGALWLDPEMTSPYAFYQQWVNAGDVEVMGWLKALTYIDREDFAVLEKEVAERPAARMAQRRLAESLTTLVHGERETAQVIAASEALFGRGALADLAPTTLRDALVEAGLTTLPAGPVPPIAALFKESGLVSSMNEARRAVADGGAYLNNVRVTDPEAVPGKDDLLHGRWLVLRRGKKTVAGVELGI